MTDSYSNHATGLLVSMPVTGCRVHADGAVTETEAEIICEKELEISVNGTPAFLLTCTPEHLTELTLGRLCTAGIIRHAEDVEHLFICGEGNIAEVRLREGIGFKAAFAAEPTCCTGNRQYLQGTGGEMPEGLPLASFTPEDVFTLAEYFRKDSALHKSTGGTHSCYIRFGDGSIGSFEDIGRHNALDKAVGAMLLKHEDPGKCMLYTSGRVPADMAEKVIRAGIPVLISKAVPTDRSIRLAEQYGLRLLVRAGTDHFEEMHL